MLFQFFRIYLIFTLVVTCSLASAVEYEYKLLKDIRSEIVLPTISTPERLLVLNQIQFVYDELFIHQEVKLRDFGISANPTADINNLKARVDTLSDTEFYQQVIKTYNGLRDRHTGVVLPKPYSCYRSVLPFNFKEVLDDQGKYVVAVEKFASKEFTSQMSQTLPVKIGDVLVSYNRVAADKHLKDMISESIGANKDAQRRHALTTFSTKSHAYYLLSDEDSIKLKLRNQDGDEYEIEAPWIVRKNIDCLKKDEFQDAGAPREEFNQIFSENSNLEEEWVTTDDPALKYKKIKNEHGSFAIIKIESFYPTVFNSSEMIDKIKYLLENEFAYFVEGLIFDIRDNSGGYIRIAENIVQLFSPEHITPLNFRLKVSPTNVFFWNTAPYYSSSHYTNALNTGRPHGQNYVELPLSLNSNTHSTGQVFFKPVAVLNNALCYSSCDMFSAKVQDFGAAKVFGEDSTTGAGGANNWTYSGIYSDLPKDKKGPFVKLPNGMDIDFSYRQSVRTGTHSRELIENVGVISDQIIKPTLSDLRSGSSEQYEIISKYLAERRDDYISSVTILNSGVSVAQDEKISVTALWVYTNSIDFLVDGKLIGTTKTKNHSSGYSSIDLAGEIDTTKIGDFSIEIVGRFNGKKVWRKVFNYNVRPRT